VGRKTVQRWQSGAVAVPGDIAAELREMTTIARPPDGSTAADDRGAACADAIAPVLGGMTLRAVDMGWSEAEVTVAVISIAAGELRSVAGAEAAADLLRAVAAGIESGHAGDT
jgi:hypothetical protein